jgi:hypothetical protein
MSDIEIVRGQEMEDFAEMIRYLALAEIRARTPRRGEAFQVVPRSRLDGSPKLACLGCGGVNWHVPECEIAGRHWAGCPKEQK